jgi:hypothetical protein
LGVEREVDNPTPGKICVQKTSEMPHIEASHEGGQGPEEAVAPYMDGYFVKRKSSILKNKTVI